MSYGRLRVDFVGDTCSTVTMRNIHLSRWWQRITITRILGHIACLVLSCHDLYGYLYKQRVQDMKWVKIVKQTCDRECRALTNDEFCGVRARSVVKQAFEWNVKQDGRLWRKLFLWTSDIRTELWLHGGFPPRADHQHSILLFHIFDLEASSRECQRQGTNERWHLEHRAWLNE